MFTVIAKVFDSITTDLAEWIGQQRMFFVATAPLAPDGLVNCSPKGSDTFRILGPHEVAYLDLTGSGIETVAHLRENGRIVFMFCAFEGPPKILRLHGMGTPIPAGSGEFGDLSKEFPDHPGTRSIIRATIHRISDSCGYAVPSYQFVNDRDTLHLWAESKGPDGVRQYQHQKNRESLDGLPALSPPDEQ